MNIETLKKEIDGLSPERISLFLTGNNLEVFNLFQTHFCDKVCSKLSFDNQKHFKDSLKLLEKVLEDKKKRPEVYEKLLEKIYIKKDNYYVLKENLELSESSKGFNKFIKEGVMAVNDIVKLKEDFGQYSQGLEGTIMDSSFPRGDKVPIIFTVEFEIPGSLEKKDLFWIDQVSVPMECLEVIARWDKKTKTYSSDDLHKPRYSHLTPMTIESEIKIYS